MLLPNSPATLFILLQLRDRRPKLQSFCEAFIKDAKREKILASLKEALDQETDR
jgi:hypothetical protein